MFDVGKIQTGLENLRRVYCNAGYVNFTSVPDTQVDEPNRMISLRVEVDEGPVYRYGKLIVDGEESELGARQKLLAAWKPYQGRLYDCGKSLENFLHDLHARPNVKPDQVLKTSMDNEAQTVNVQITLAKSPK